MITKTFTNAADLACSVMEALLQGMGWALHPLPSEIHTLYPGKQTHYADSSNERHYTIRGFMATLKWEKLTIVTLTREGNPDAFEVPICVMDWHPCRLPHSPGSSPDQTRASLFKKQLATFTSLWTVGKMRGITCIE